MDHLQVDWLPIVQGQQKIAHDLGSIAMEQLANSYLTSKEIGKLQDQVEMGTATYNALLRALAPKIIDEAFLFRTEALSRFWSDLARMIDEKQQELEARKLARVRRGH